MTRFARSSWALLVLTTGVIAGGAVVRATGSGAGCGSNWPECNGGVVAFSGSTETVIEFSHRFTSGLAFLGVLALWIWARRQYQSGDRVRRAAAWAVGFIAVEVVIGAALVTYEWVGDDASVARAAVDGFHLVNTLFLLTALTLTAWWAGGGAALAINGTEARWLAVGLGAVLLVASAGALTALGDTLFPDATLADDFSSSSHFLVRLRTIHPIIAVITAGYLLVLARRYLAWESRRSAALARLLATVVVAQLLAGVINLALSAPLAMQLIHLLLADVLWIVLILVSVNVLAAHQREEVSV